MTPSRSKYLVRRVANFCHSRIRYRKERALLKGRGFPSSNRRSVLFFTTHKCASTYVPKCLKYLNKRYLGMTHVDLETYIWNYSNENVHRYLADHSETLFVKKGMIYAPLRGYIQISELNDYRAILFLRDPRDMLVSQYYSVGFNHTLPSDPGRREHFLNRRNRANATDINAYVLNFSDQFLRIYEEYCENLVGDPSVVLLRYEVFANDFEYWIRQLATALDLELSDNDRMNLWRLKGGALPSKENRYLHVRRGEPGDFRNKLSEETQARLTERFSHVLTTLEEYGQP